MALNLPAPFDNTAIYHELCIKTLHGQNKDALAKTQLGNWKYDIVEAGYKCNMTDIAAAIGLVELERYDTDTLIRRKEIASLYSQLLTNDDRFQLPVFLNEEKESCFHLYPLRVNGITEEQRDAIMQHIFAAGVSVNVHFQPVPGMSYYKKLGYNLKNYPITLDNYSREISLPLYYNLSDEQVKTVVTALLNAVNKVC